MSFIDKEHLMKRKLKSKTVMYYGESIWAWEKTRRLLNLVVIRKRNQIRINVAKVKQWAQTVVDLPGQTYVTQDDIRIMLGLHRDCEIRAFIEQAAIFVAKTMDAPRRTDTQYYSRCISNRMEDVDWYFPSVVQLTRKDMSDQGDMDT